MYAVFASVITLGICITVVYILVGEIVTMFGPHQCVVFADASGKFILLVLHRWHWVGQLASDGVASGSLHWVTCIGHLALGGIASICYRKIFVT